MVRDFTYEEASQIIYKIVYGTLNNNPSKKELLELRRFLEGLQREAQIQYLCDNYSVEDLREMGFDI